MVLCNGLEIMLYYVWCDDFLTGLHYLAYSCSHANRCETINTLISFLWWIIGFYWLVSGGEVLEYGAPRLYWYVTFILPAS
jgi:hypothetical protein